MDNSDKHAIDTLHQLTDENASYWQRGFNDGLAGRPENIPDPKGAKWNRFNLGYRNGYRRGAEKRGLQGHVEPGNTP